LWYVTECISYQHRTITTTIIIIIITLITPIVIADCCLAEYDAV
jgi:hypothetical protein